MRAAAAPYIVEFLGTFVFLAAVLVSGGHPLAMGATLAALVYLGAGVSGGHFNPAVTLVMAAKRDGALPLAQVLPYIVAQVAGALSAVAAVGAARM